MATSDIKKGPLYVDSTNNRVGIGTSSPVGQLMVQSAVNSTGYTEMLRLEGQTLANGWERGIGFFGNDGALEVSRISSYLTGTERHLRFTSAGVLGMTIRETGFVGVGESSPQKMLHITKNDSDGMIVLDANGATTDHQICFTKNYGTGGTTGGNYWGIGVDGSENKLVFAYDPNAQASLAADAKVVLDSSGSVGIGTSSPIAQSKLTVAGDSLSLTGSDGDFGAGGVRGMLDLAGGYLRMGAVNGGGSASGVKLLAPAGQEALVVDTSGRVTMPYQPAFMASATGNGNYTFVSSGTAFPANTAYKNVGGHYNTTTYRFTAPVDGFYLFCWSALTNNTTSQSRPTIMVNGSTSGHAGGFRPMAGNDPGALGNMFSTITYLSANDYVSAASDSGNLYFYGAQHNAFSGTLLS